MPSYTSSIRLGKQLQPSLSRIAPHHLSPICSTAAPPISADAHAATHEWPLAALPRQARNSRCVARAPPTRPSNPGCASLNATAGCRASLCRHEPPPRESVL
eukprot:996322-Pleurochrysis_carterae.AAC.4